MKILTHLNLSQNELQNAVLHKLATAPANPVVGQIYFNTTDKKAYIYQETGWENLGLSETLIQKLEGIEAGADKVLYGTLPEANAENNGKVVIYTGAKTEDLTPGLVYVCNGTEWIEATPTFVGEETDTTVTTIADGAIATDVKISEDANNAIQIKTVDGVAGLYVEATDISAATEDEDGLMTSDDKKKLNALSETAEENVIDEVKVNGVALTVADKAVNVEVAAADNSLAVATDAAGKVTVAAKISATADNSLSVKDDGLYVAVPEITVPEYSVVKDETAEAGAIATYHLTKDGVNVGAAINVPKDFLVKSASVEEVAEADVPYAGAKVGDKYLDFVVNVKAGEAEEDAHIYLPVNELVDVYTAGNGIEISAANVVSAKVVAENGLSVDENGIKLAVATETTAGAMSAEDKVKLNGVAAGAQVNVIEGVQVNGVDLTIDENKKVNVTMPVVSTTQDGLMAKEDKIALDKAVTDIADHETRVAALETKTTTQNTAIEEINGKITALETKDAELVEDIAELVAKDTEIAGKITANETAIAGKQDKLTAGDFIEITDTNVINAKLPTASTTSLGMVQIGSGLAISEAGVVTVTGATTAESVEWTGVLNKPSTLGAENGPVGTFHKVTVDKYGLVTAGAELTAEDLPDLSAEYIAVEEKGAANGVATLDGNKKIVLAQLPDAVLGNVKYGGTFDANSGVVALVDGKILGADGVEYTELTLNADNAANFRGYYFIAANSGTIVGIDFLVGDWCISNGTAGWAKVDNTDAVTGVKGVKEDAYRIGNVELTAANVGAVEANAAIAGGTFAKVTVDTKGLVTGGVEKLTTSDISDFNAGDYVPATMEGQGNKSLVTDENGNVTTVAHKYVQAFGNGTSLTYAIVHNMGTKDVIVQVSTADTYEVVYANTVITDENTITLTFAQAPAQDAYRVIVIA